MVTSVSLLQVVILGVGNVLLLSGYLMSDPKLLRALCASGICPAP